MSVISEETNHRQERQSDAIQSVDLHHAQPKRSIILEDNSPPQPLSLENRKLPTRSVTDENFDDVYVRFIMYCNPTIPRETDTSELRQIFRAPPKSDGKSFNTFTLFQLIKRLELKELKTWAQLAIELGVEPPALEKGQSAQKVQQYAVRLKRWMHAMHVDAFFEYLLSKSHVYWTCVPALNSSALELGRDGVVPEEDLALRALLPEMKPKRGRRRNADDKEDGDLRKSPSQRPRVGSPTLSEGFMMAGNSMARENPTPATAHPGFGQTFDDRLMPWSATEMRAQLGSFRWPPSDSAQTPLTAYPQSAITPTNRSHLWNDESQYTIAPKSRSRRRHGPAVSSAWPSKGSTTSGKLRGRPPSNQSVTDGPYSTFPANPSPKDTPPSNALNSISSAVPVTAESKISHFYAAEVMTNQPNPIIQGSRPSRLSLQVPQREGGSVRLATPPPAPPVLLVNGEGDRQMQQNSIANSQQPTPLMEYFNSPGYQNPSFQHFVSIAFRQNEDTDRTNMDALESHFISEILAADWYDATGHSIERCTIDEADKICKQVIQNLKSESSGTEAFLINLSALAGGPLMTRLRMTRLEQRPMALYECHLKMRFGSIEGDITIRAAVNKNSEVPSLEQVPEIDENDEDWKKRYLDLKQQIKDRDEKVGRLKRGVLDALVAVNPFGKI